MLVIRTSVRRRLMKAAVPLLITACGFGAVMLPSLMGMYGTIGSDEDYELRYCGIENMNEDEPVLLEISHKAESEQLVPEVSTQEQDDPKFVTENVTVAENVNTETVESTSDFPGKYLTTVNLSDETEDLTLFTLHSGHIYEETFGKANGPEYTDLPGGGQLRNCTDIPDETVRYELGKDSVTGVTLFSDEPQVLIIHTHTTESYEPYTKDWYDERYTSRSFDPDYSVVAVGDAIAEQLAEAGISVIHDCTVHDAVYSGAYSRSLGTTLTEMERYPSIKIVLDIHRDAIEYSDGSRVSAVTMIDGKKAAQVMLICAADDGTYGVPGFFDNLRFASELQQSMESLFPTLTRPILFQYCQYNQQVSPGALLIEVGSHGNSIEQATYSGELIGRSLAAMLARDESEPEAVQVFAGMPRYFLDRVR
ncbi:MAG: stage II sporulation protein P [Ruminiclostridium sp.]|nr:stage II sporulation protein P [Ruminiclostridium sp.]